ncbi:hypothetical protein BDK51DRAFT_30433 [Blyttiomyces helicus]|uniref:Uncharacterized protein n=1 Tax=Blyttiomyces helicus TaxID=388810 RepID=A0A4P9WRK7_9FUNG|nr:hypothetical protein BDK51DRAFT_30433 [Blyttiomyces helicus]|eukprot:RKO93920.1 hypothetical protein BDK51DRAFT_30433 [Blyttiomyces helicus]
MIVDCRLVLGQAEVAIVGRGFGIQTDPLVRDEGVKISTFEIDYKGKEAETLSLVRHLLDYSDFAFPNARRRATLQDRGPAFPLSGETYSTMIIAPDTNLKKGRIAVARNEGAPGSDKERQAQGGRPAGGDSPFGQQKASKSAYDWPSSHSPLTLCFFFHLHETVGAEEKNIEGTLVVLRGPRGE